MISFSKVSSTEISKNPNRWNCIIAFTKAQNGRENRKSHSDSFAYFTCWVLYVPDDWSIAGTLEIRNWISGWMRMMLDFRMCRVFFPCFFNYYNFFWDPACARMAIGHEILSSRFACLFILIVFFDLLWLCSPLCT